MFGLSDEEFLRNQREMFYDRKFDASMEGVAEAAAAEASGAAMGGAPPGAPPGMEGAPPMPGGLEGEAPVDDMAAAGVPEGAPAEGAPAEGGGEEGGGEEGPLLAAPGKRDDRTTTPRSKGKWYTPVKDDKRDMGARSRHYKGMWANELSKNTLRNTHKGALEFLSLGKGISEGQETNYKEEEQKLFEVKKGSKEIQEILRDMESDSETKTQ